MSHSGAELDSQAVEALRTYLQIPSVHPDVDYGPCEEWVRAQAASLGLPVRAESPSKAEKPVLIVTWEGSQPQLPSVMLNSHMDVVPVYEHMWTHPPFGAERTEDGNIYARGAQDMKSVGVQYLEAVRRLRAKGFQPRRTVHIVFVPDEEIGGDEGMGAFVKTRTFIEMNIGFSLDEGMACPEDEFILFHAERSSWKLEFTCRGSTGHGSMLLDDTAAESVRVILNHLLDFRTAKKAQVAQPFDQGHVTAVNITMLKGGVQNNVLPPEMTLIADVRISPEDDHEEFVKMVQGWCDEAGDADVRFTERGEMEGITELNESNEWWQTLKSVFGRLNQKILPAVCPAASDARYLRRLKIPAIGISMINKTPILMHDHDEFINEEVFLRGITIYEELLRSLAV